MKRINLLLVACVMGIVAFGQDKVVNDPNAEVRNVASFHGIKVATGIDLLLQQGNAEAVAVSAATSEYRDHIITTVEGGVLSIRFDNKWYQNWGDHRNKKLKAYVSFRQIDMLHGSSGAQITVEGKIKAAQLKLDLSSGAGFKGSVEANRLSVDGSSGAIANISGSAANASFDASSGSAIHGFDLASDVCDADVSSGALVQVSVNKELSADASSGGDIRYKGAGVITKVSTGSGGSVKKNG